MILIIITVAIPTMIAIIPSHISRVQTRSFCAIYGKANYADFKREFDNTEWVYNPMWSNSLFDLQYNSEIHAGVLRFNNVGMLLGPVAYCRAIMLKAKKIKQLRGKGGRDRASFNELIEKS